MTRMTIGGGRRLGTPPGSRALMGHSGHQKPRQMARPSGTAHSRWRARALLGARPEPRHPFPTPHRSVPPRPHSRQPAVPPARQASGPGRPEGVATAGRTRAAETGAWLGLRLGLSLRLPLALRLALWLALRLGLSLQVALAERLGLLLALSLRLTLMLRPGTRVGGPGFPASGRIRPARAGVGCAGASWGRKTHPQARSNAWRGKRKKGLGVNGCLPGAHAPALAAARAD